MDDVDRCDRYVKKKLSETLSKNSAAFTALTMGVRDLQALAASTDPPDPSFPYEPFQAEKQKQ